MVNGVRDTELSGAQFPHLRAWRLQQHICMASYLASPIRYCSQNDMVAAVK